VLLLGPRRWRGELLNSRRLPKGWRLQTGAKAELDRMRSVFHSDKNGLRRELQQAHTDKETEKQADEDIMRLQK